MQWHGDHTAFHLGQIDARVTALEKDLSAIKHWGIRGGLLAILWLVALASNMETDRAAALIVELLKKL